MSTIKEHIERIKQGTSSIISENELAEKLKLGRPLRIKAGFDPTAPDLHLGHAVLLHKLALFQSLGHELHIIIGDFTGRIGDPTGKNVTRPPLTEEEVMANALTYKEQFFRILDPLKTKIHFNSTWLKPFDGVQMIRLASQYTVAQMLERDDYRKRYEEGRPIAIHEFLYPLLQGYDSVALMADVEMGGNDQTFNLLVGRDLQKQANQPPQVVITVPLLEGLDGVKKMSKSLGNYIALTEAPDSQYGKIMSISDTLMWRYYELLSDLSLADIERLKRQVAEGLNPRDCKMQLAALLVARYHGAEASKAAESQFIAQVQQRQIPEEITDFTLATAMPLAQALKELGALPSTSKVLQMIEQGGIKIDGQKIEQNLTLNAGHTYLIQVGKRQFLRVHVKN